MGAACCVAAKDRTIVHGPSGGTLQRHVPYSPSWSFRWENRGRVAGEETQSNWLHDGDVRNDQVEVKYSNTVETASSREEGNPLDNRRSCWQKSPLSDENAGNSKLQVSDISVSRNLVKVKDSAESSSSSHPSLVKLSPLAASPTSPMTSKGQLLRPKSTPSRCHRYSCGPQSLHQVSEYKSPPFSISEEASSHLPPDWVSESTGDSMGESSESWSVPVSSELMTTSRERFSIDSEKLGRNSVSPIDLQTCGVCAKLLTTRSSWGWTNQKIVSTNELAVVSVLPCGHVYHAECLEYMTPEINKYDPVCPVCTYGEKQAMKMSEKALKAELDIKARRKHKKHVADSDRTSNILFDHHLHSGAEGRDSKISSSLMRRSSFGKPFLKRHLSFASESVKSLQGNKFGRRKAFFWAKSSKD